jgi:hypothetical protein
MSDPTEPDDEKIPSFSESLSAAAKQSGSGQLKPGETPTAKSLLAAIGGVRGIAESVLPVIAFLVIYLITRNLLVSVLVPVAISVVFLVVRAVTRSNMTSAVAGAVLLAVSAVLTLLTNNVITNFVPGMVLNAVFLVGLLVSILVRWPLIGVIVGLLYGDMTGWRDEPAKRRILTLATWLWVGLFAVRLAIELPLYFTDNFTALGIARLLTSVPLYALCLWGTWLLVRGVYEGDSSSDDEKDDDEEASTNP